mmetsp:Transcript_7486/g.21168  ORF Transcript_7486/g.21168 Transcript_7486/m.21168 type:complete len:180 (-) Transcript_7486:107-646(-)
MALQVKRLRPDAILPTRGSPLSAGYDLHAADATTVPARGKALVSTGLAVKCPEGSYGRIAPRSGLAWKNHVDVGAGVVDADYRGEVRVVLFNHAAEDLEINAGDRIAQLVLERILMLPLEEVEDLDATDRGAGGFGSTGVAAVKAGEQVPPAKRVCPADAATGDAAAAAEPAENPVAGN